MCSVRTSSLGNSTNRQWSELSPLGQSLVHGERPDLAWIRGIAELNNLSWVVDVCRTDQTLVASHEKSHISVSTSGYPLDLIHSVTSASAEHKSFCCLLNALVMPGDGLAEASLKSLGSVELSLKS
jgi:hypothetical protein